MHKFVFSYLPIRMQLILLAILLTLPALGIIVYAGLKERRDDYRKAVVESQKLVDNLSAQQEDLLHEAQQIVRIPGRVAGCCQSQHTAKCSPSSAAPLKTTPSI